MQLFAGEREQKDLVAIDGEEGQEGDEDAKEDIAKVAFFAVGELHGAPMF